MWVDLFNPKKDSIEIHNIPLLLKNLRIRKIKGIYIDSWVKILLCCVTTCHKLDDYHKLGRRALSWHKTLLQLTLTTRHYIQWTVCVGQHFVTQIVYNYKSCVISGPIQKIFQYLFKYQHNSSLIFSWKCWNQ